MRTNAIDQNPASSVPAAPSLVQRRLLQVAASALAQPGRGSTGHIVELEKLQVVRCHGFYGQRSGQALSWNRRYVMSHCVQSIADALPCSCFCCSIARWSGSISCFGQGWGGAEDDKGSTGSHKDLMRLHPKHHRLNLGPSLATKCVYTYIYVYM